MTPFYNPELEETLKKKKFTYEEVYLMAEHIHKKAKRTKYLTLLFVGLWAPAVTLLCWMNYQHPVSFITGAVSSTFAIYVLDETYEAIFNHIARKMRENDNDDEQE